MIPSGKTKIPQAVWRRKRRGELRGWERKDGKDGRGGKGRGGEEKRQEERKRKEGRKEKKIKGCFFLNQTSPSDVLLITPADFNIQECQDQWSRTNGDQTN